MAEPTPDEQRWLARVKELEWRAELARLVLAGDTQALSELLAKGPAPSSDPQLQRELAKLRGSSPSFGRSLETSTDEDFAAYLDELERLCDAATPGPWAVNEAEWSVEGERGLLVCDFPDAAADATDLDATFIATARDALPKLIAKVRELQSRMDDAQKAIDEFGDVPSAALGIVADRLHLQCDYPRLANARRGQ